MTRDEAIAWYREITSGKGVDRYAELDVVHRGEVAEALWEDSTFAFGVEYGVLIALVRVFDLTAEDLGYE